MDLREDDPIYYKVKLNKLINQALENGLTITGKHLDNGMIIAFEASNGDVCGVELTEE